MHLVSQSYVEFIDFFSSVTSLIRKPGQSRAQALNGRVHIYNLMVATFVPALVALFSLAGAQLRAEREERPCRALECSSLIVRSAPSALTWCATTRVQLNACRQLLIDILNAREDIAPGLPVNCTLDNGTIAMPNVVPMCAFRENM